VVTGGTFFRSYDGVNYTDKSYPATVCGFRLDTYEISVGRFRKFVAAYSQAMTPSGAGKNPNNAADTGWSTGWNTSLPADATALKAGLKACAGPKPSTWTDNAGSNEKLPITCVTWYEAFAFCIWDGGRLPTEAEWNYAAAGGAEQRVYPWSVPAASTSIDCAHANYDDGAGQTCPAHQSNNVGSESPKGDGRWGQADLAGNVSEWLRDWYVAPYPNPCDNCANLAASYDRVARGGTFYADVSGLLSSMRGHFSSSSDRWDAVGARCARRP